MTYTASSTYKTFLMRGTTANDTTTWAKVCDIKSFPDLGQTPEMLDTTTLTDAARTHIFGIQEQDALTFDANFNKTDYQACQAHATADKTTPGDYAVWFGGTEVAGSDPTPVGDLGKFTFKGIMADPTVQGGGVNEVRNMQITIALTSKIDVSFAS